MTTLALALVLAYVPYLAGPYSLAKLLAVACGGLWLAFGRLRRVGAIPAAYLAVLALCTVISVDPWLSFWGGHGTLNTGLVCAAVLVPYWTSVGSDDREGLVSGLRLGAAVSSIIALWQWLVATPTFLGFHGRSYAAMGSPVYFGALLALAAPFAESPWELGLLVAGAFSCGSRSAFLGIGAGLAWILWPQISKRLKAVGLSLAIITIAIFLSHHKYSASDSGRLLVWRAAWGAFKSHPFFGVGTGAFLPVAEASRSKAWLAVYGVTTQDHAHNLILEALSSTGLVGLAAFVAFAWTLWRGADLRTRGALLGVFVVGLFEPLPLIVKALAIALAASCRADQIPRNVRTCQWGVRVLSCNIILTVAFLTCWDQLIYRYGDVPWCFSSIESAKKLGLLRLRNVEVVTQP